MNQQSNEILYHTILVILMVIVLACLAQFGLHKFTAVLESKLVNAASQR